MESGSYERFVNRLRPRLVRIAARVVGPSHAEDVVQDALVDVGPGRQADDLESYLVTAVQNAAKDHARTEERDFERIEDHVIRFGSPLVVEDVASVERGIDVRRVLDTLPADIKAAVWAVFAEGATWREAAEEQGVSVMTLHNRVDKWLPTLRDQLGRTNPSSAASYIAKDEGDQR